MEQLKAFNSLSKNDKVRIFNIIFITVTMILNLIGCYSESKNFQEYLFDVGIFAFFLIPLILTTDIRVSIAIFLISGFFSSLDSDAGNLTGAAFFSLSKIYSKKIDSEGMFPWYIYTIIFFTLITKHVFLGLSIHNAIKNLIGYIFFIGLLDITLESE